MTLNFRSSSLYRPPTPRAGITVICRHHPLILLFCPLAVRTGPFPEIGHKIPGLGLLTGQWEKEACARGVSELDGPSRSCSSSLLFPLHSTCCHLREVSRTPSSQLIPGEYWSLVVPLHGESQSPWASSPQEPWGLCLCSEACAESSGKAELGLGSSQ